MPTATERPELKAEGMRSVYSGKDGRCCCGCSGKHSYASSVAKAASESSGYAVTVNDRMVAKVVRILNAAAPEDLEIGGNYFATVVGSRLYIAYPKATN